MRKRRIYISGAIAHLDLGERRSAFKEAQQEWEERGYDTFNPFENGLPEDAPWREHMRRDIAELLQCDSIYMLRDWEQSKGCKLELDVASSCGIPVIMETDNQYLDI